MNILKIFCIVLIMVGCSTINIRPGDSNFDEESGQYVVNRKSVLSLHHFFEATHPEIDVIFDLADVTDEIQKDNDLICNAQFPGTKWIGGIYKDGGWDRRLCAFDRIIKLQAFNNCKKLRFNGQRFKLKDSGPQHFVCVIEK